jgi:hypothetical protein
MGDKKILTELFHSSVLIPMATEYEKPIIRLQEPQVNNCVTVIRNPPSDAIIIKADAFPSPKSFFKGDKGECKRADFIVVSPEKKVILYIEMKSGFEDASHIVKQLKGAACVIAYCKEVVKHFWNKNAFLGDYEHRYIGLINLSINKKPSRIKSTNHTHDTPDNFLKISSQCNLQFRALAERH